MQQMNQQRYTMRDEQVAPGHDPAPSVWNYKLQRLWLTPVFRTFVRVGLPAFFVVFFILAFISSEKNMNYVRGLVQDAQETVHSRPEHMLNAVMVDGASDQLLEEIESDFAEVLPVSSFQLDLDEVRAGLEDLPTVDTAVLRIQSDGVLAIQVLEVQPKFIWRTHDGLALLSETGQVLRSIDARSQYPALPLIAGVGADQHLDEVLDVLSAAAPLSDRLRGLVRIGERRWDIVLSGGQRILLPDTDPAAAAHRAIVLSMAQDILGRDVKILDVRNPRRPTIRLRADALEQLRATKALMTVEYVK